MALLPHAGEAKFSGPVEKVSAVAYSPDGRFFAQGTEEGGVTFFRTDGTAEPVRRQLGGEVKTIVFGEGWAGAASETKFAMWDTKTRVVRRVNWAAPGGPKIEDCDLQESRIKVFGKGRKERIIEFSPVTGKHIWRYLAERRN